MLAFPDFVWGVKNKLLEYQLPEALFKSKYVTKV